MKPGMNSFLNHLKVYHPHFYDVIQSDRSVENPELIIIRAEPHNDAFFLKKAASIGLTLGAISNCIPVTVLNTPIFSSSMTIPNLLPAFYNMLKEASLTNFIKDNYELVCEGVRKIIDSCRSASILIDGWTRKSKMEYYIGFLVVLYVSKESGQEYFALEMKNLDPERKNADGVKAELDSVIIKWFSGDNRNKIRCIVTDGEAKTIKAVLPYSYTPENLDTLVLGEEYEISAKDVFHPEPITEHFSPGCDRDVEEDKDDMIQAFETAATKS